MTVILWRWCWGSSSGLRSTAVRLRVTGYSTRFTLIDKTLLESRNGIAHGEHLVINAARFDSLVLEILEVLRWFKTDIENAVVQKSFLRSSALQDGSRHIPSNNGCLIPES